MKLLHQINLAFGLLLVLVLGATAALIHFVLMDHFIDSQRRELNTIGATVATNLQMQALRADGEKTVALEAVAVPSGIAAYITDGKGNIVSDNTRTASAATAAASSSPLALTPVASLIPVATAIPVAPSAPSDSLGMKQTELSEGTSVLVQEQVQAGKATGSFIVSQSLVPQGTLTLATPLSQVKAVERALFGRLLIVLGVGAAVVLLLSLLLTRKLIHPLMKLRSELGKVKERQFADVRLIKAEGEIGAVARTVYELAGELDRYNRVQKQFIQNASHELKTPLMSIAGYAEGIRDGIFEGESSRKGLDVIIGESGRLNRIVTEMTLLAKLDSEADVYHPSDVSVEELLTEVEERINPLLAKRGIGLRMEGLEAARGRLTVRADRDKLLQALLNVVSNAARYANSRIVVEATEREGRVVIAIADDGRGIPETLLPHLFHRFVKGKDGENGLGLAISRAIVERGGGLIRAANRESGGAIITLQLPAASA